jgi:hypothetical protein
VFCVASPGAESAALATRSKEYIHQTHTLKLSQYLIMLSRLTTGDERRDGGADVHAGWQLPGQHSVMHDILAPLLGNGHSGQ